LVSAHYRKAPVPPLAGPMTTVLIEDADGSRREVSVGSDRIEGKWHVAMEGPDEYRYLIDSGEWETFLAAIASQ